MAAATYTEFQDSQLPALQLLQKLGYTYISPSDALESRNNQLHQPILERILKERLEHLNSFEYKGKNYQFSEGNIQAAINLLKNIPDDNVVLANEKVYDLLTLGESFEERVQGDKKSFTLRYIDWDNLDNNVYHVTDEYLVAGVQERRRTDIVLFVNGIPFVILENKRRDKTAAIAEGISQHIRNQKRKEGVPRLYYYAQLLLAVQPNELRYSVTGTPAKFWNIWKEDGLDAPVQQLLQSTKNGMVAEQRLPTEQDKILYALCRRERLMELVYQYVLFDRPNKKIARYQQYFAVQETLQRVKQQNATGKREGGVIWHTQGSGKSLTMVMLAKALALDKDIANPQVIVVTDRINLDKQISRTFNNCQKEATKARSGAHLVKLLEEGVVEVMTTIIHKFDTASRKKDFINANNNIFVLIDESHRSQYGDAHRKMRRILPNACYIGFTGTPLMQKNKSTSEKFGGYIHEYTIDQAVKDKAVLPLLYEGRSAKITVNGKSLEKRFERLVKGRTEDEKALLKKEGASIWKILQSKQVVEEIAYDISEHYRENFKHSPFKAQLAVPSKYAAIRYLECFENEIDPDLKIHAKVIISPPDTREGHDEIYDEAKDAIQQFWTKTMAGYRNAEEYEETIIDKFKDPDDHEVELLIVVSKLLTGFDAPNNTILYLAKPLAEHNLLQAIARVNRLFSYQNEEEKQEKEFGFIIDYVGVLGKLDEALTNYSALDDFEEEQIKGAAYSILEEIRKLPHKYAALIAIFKAVENKADNEAMERHLRHKDVRDNFYEKLTEFAKQLQLALSSELTSEEFSEDKLTFYKTELKRYEQLRQSVRHRYFEKKSFKEYNTRIQNLLDTYVVAEEVVPYTRQVNIFDKTSREEEIVAQQKTPASKADHIAFKMKKSIEEKMDKDRVFYKKFSDLLKEKIKAFEEGRLEEAAYLEQIYQLNKDFENGVQKGIPKKIIHHPKARAFFGSLQALMTAKKRVLQAATIEQLATASLEIDRLIENLIIRDWKRNEDVKKEMKNEIEDYLLLELSPLLKHPLTYADVDEEFLDSLIKTAVNNY